jgi:predicted RNA-binding protein with PIN domain
MAFATLRKHRANMLILVFDRMRVRARQDTSDHEEKDAHFNDRKKTPEDFIERCAIQSLLTRKLYLVVCNKGRSNNNQRVAERRTCGVREQRFR